MENQNISKLWKQFLLDYDSYLIKRRLKSNSWISSMRKISKEKWEIKLGKLN